MNVKKIRSSKALKLLGLVISSLFIATVSAQVYNYMYVEGSGYASTTTGLKWELGADAPGTAAIDGYTVTNLNFSISATPANRSDCLRIVNQDGASHIFNLRTMESWGNYTNFQEFNMVVFNGDPEGAGVQQDVLDLSTEGATTGDMTIPASATWYILVEIVPISNPLGQTVFFEVELMYESSA
jgi:hypothetical protein